MRRTVAVPQTQGGGKIEGTVGPDPENPARGGRPSRQAQEQWADYVLALKGNQGGPER